MTDVPTFLELAGVSAVGVIGLLLAIILLFVGRSRGKVAFSLGLLTLCLLGAATVVGVRLKLPTPIVVATGILAGLWAIGLVVRSRTTARFTQGTLLFLGRPMVQGFVLLVLSLGVVVGWPLWLEYRDSRPEDDPFWSTLGLEKAELEPEPFQAATDRGNPLPLFRTTPNTQTMTPDREKVHFANMGYQVRLIQTEGARLECNCHGWVFTEGRHWIKGGDVSQILSENGYRQITDPRADDLVIYRSEKGEILHTALVRSVLPDGTKLVEGKWGQLGRFLHRVEDQSYSTRWTFYRSSRRGHVLAGINGGATGDGYTTHGRTSSVGTH